jgi:hypothetical protein
LLATQAECQDPSVPPIAAYEIQLEGANWILRYGAEKGLYPEKDYGALATVAKLLARPGVYLDLKDLVDADTRKLLDCRESRTDALDDEGIGRLKRRYTELKADMAGEQDPLVRKENEQELKSIAAEVKKATGPGNRKRKLGRTLAEKAWDALTTQLRRLWPRLRDNKMPQLADHLEQSIRCNYPSIAYIPPDGTSSWAVTT